MMNVWKERAVRRKVFKDLRKTSIYLLDDSDPVVFSTGEPFELEMKFVFDKPFRWVGFEIRSITGDLYLRDYFPAAFEGNAGDMVFLQTGGMIVENMWSVEELYEEFSP